MRTPEELVQTIDSGIDTPFNGTWFPARSGIFLPSGLALPECIEVDLHNPNLVLCPVEIASTGSLYIVHAVLPDPFCFYQVSSRSEGDNSPRLIRVSDGYKIMYLFQRTEELPVHTREDHQDFTRAVIMTREDQTLILQGNEKEAEKITNELFPN